MRLAVAMYHFGTRAMLQTLKIVFPDDPYLLYRELEKLVNMKFGKKKNTIKGQFRRDELELMLPVNLQTDSNKFDITLTSKIISACQDAGYTYNHKTFVKPTGLVFDAKKLPSLLTANTGDLVQLLKDLRNCILHAPTQEIPEQDFKNLWTFMTEIFKKIGYNAPDLIELQHGSIVTHKYMQALLKSINDFFTQLEKDTTTLVTTEVAKNYLHLKSGINYINHLLCIIASETKGARNEFEMLKVKQNFETEALCDEIEEERFRLDDLERAARNELDSLKKNIVDIQKSINLELDTHTDQIQELYDELDEGRRRVDDLETGATSMQQQIDEQDLEMCRQRKQILAIENAQESDRFQMDDLKRNVDAISKVVMLKENKKVDPYGGQSKCNICTN